MPSLDARQRDSFPKLRTSLLIMIPSNQNAEIRSSPREIVDAVITFQSQLPGVPSLALNIPSAGAGPPSPESEAADWEDLAPITEPQKLFTTGELGCFVECGGYGGLESPAKMSAFNPEEDCFVTIFPGKKRIYRFDVFGTLWEKFQSDAQPLCITWNHDYREYVIGFADRRICWFNHRLQRIGSVKAPIEPRLIACKGDDIYVSDCGKAVIRLNRGDECLTEVNLPGEVCQLLFAEERGCLLVALSSCILGLDRGLRTLWRIDHLASRAAIASSGSGELWVALSSGHLWRFDKENRKLLDVSIPPGIRTIAVLDRVVVLGTLEGQVMLYDLYGQKLGEDDLRTCLYHLCATEGSMLVLSTARGPTVVKPSPEVTLRTEEYTLRENALGVLLEWERAVSTGKSIHKVLEGYVRQINLAHWQEVCALQWQFLQRRQVYPAFYDKIESALRFLDPERALRICEKTKPVIIDGSNVSRYHWGNKGEKHKQARLRAILRARDKLARQTNPVLYPLIVVVDASERYYTDDPATLKRMIADGEILECPSRREADVLILNLVRTHGWLDCLIVSNDRRLFQAHSEQLPSADPRWYERVRVAFTVNPITNEVYFVERSGS